MFHVRSDVSIQDRTIFTQQDPSLVMMRPVASTAQSMHCTSTGVIAVGFNVWLGIEKYVCQFFLYNLGLKIGHGGLRYDYLV